MLRGLLLGVMAVVVVGCGDSTDAAGGGGSAGNAGSAGDGGARGQLALGTPIVVDVDWLMESLTNDDDVQLVDTRTDVPFEESRIPGAIQLRPESLAMDEDDVPSQLVPPVLAEPVLGAAGLREGALVVVYGEPPEYDPARIVWALRYYQHGDVRYLDGGFAAWVAAGGEVDEEPPENTPTEYTVDGVDDRLRVTSDFVLDGIGDEPFTMPSVQLVDARSAFEYDQGRIPTARLVEWLDNLEDGFLRSTEEIAALHQGLDPATTTVTYCTLGWRGSVAWLALTYLGYDDVRLYDGSWAEWGAGDFPVEP